MRLTGMVLGALLLAGCDLQEVTEIDSDLSNLDTAKRAIVIPEGHYTISEPIRITHNNTKLLAHGASIETTYDGPAIVIGRDGKITRYCKVEGCKLKGGGIELRNVTDSHISDAYIAGSKENGVTMVNCWQNTLTNVAIKAPKKHCLETRHCTQLYINGCRFGNAQEDGWRIEGNLSGAAVSCSSIEGCAGHGIHKTPRGQLNSFTVNSLFQEGMKGYGILMNSECWGIDIRASRVQEPIKINAFYGSWQSNTVLSGKAKPEELQIELNGQWVKSLPINHVAPAFGKQLFSDGNY